MKRWAQSHIHIEGSDASNAQLGSKNSRYVLDDTESSSIGSASAIGLIHFFPFFCLYTISLGVWFLKDCGAKTRRFNSLPFMPSIIIMFFVSVPNSIYVGSSNKRNSELE